jgi:hypothetical protein
VSEFPPPAHALPPALVLAEDREPLPRLRALDDRLTVRGSFAVRPGRFRRLDATVTFDTSVNQVLVAAGTCRSPLVAEKISPTEWVQLGRTEGTGSGVRDRAVAASAGLAPVVGTESIGVEVPR